MMMKATDYIPLSHTDMRGIYICYGEIMTVAVYVGDGRFLGLRDDRPDGYLYVERHADHVENGVKGTLYPQTIYEYLPFDIAIEPLKTHAFGYLWATKGQTDVPVEKIRVGPNNDQRTLYVFAYTRVPLDKDAEVFCIGNSALVDELRAYISTPSG